MKIWITIRVQHCAYSFFCWDEETKKDYAEHEELKELINKFINASSEDERNEVSLELLDYGVNDGAIGYIDGIEVEYPGEDIPDETHTGDIDGFKFKTIEDCFGDKMDLDLCDFYICKENYSKKGCLVLEKESDKPFDINYLSMTDGVITYGMDLVEVEDYGREYDSNFYVCVTNEYKIKARGRTER